MNKKQILLYEPSCKPSSVTKWICFTQFFCFLSHIINCQEQLKTVQQTGKKKKLASFLEVRFKTFSKWIQKDKECPYEIFIIATSLFEIKKKYHIRWNTLLWTKWN